jgi:hypothetical protein
MRHFLLSELGQNAIAVPGLPHRLESSSPRFHPVCRSGATERLTSPHRPARVAQTLATIATTAETKLISALLAARETVLGRRQRAPCRRFLDMELEPW